MMGLVSCCRLSLKGRLLGQSNMNSKSQTVSTYQDAFEEFSVKFDNVRSRVHFIEHMISLVGVDRPRVFEIGCGNGKDA